MIPKEQRYSFKKGVPKNNLSTPFFTLRFQKNNASVHMGVVVSKKISVLATERNRIKRSIIEILRGIVPLEMPYDLVFYLKKEIIKQERQVLVDQFKAALQRVT